MEKEVSIQSLQLRKFEINQFHWWDYQICNLLNPSNKLAELQIYQKMPSLTKSNLTYPSLQHKNIVKEPRGFVEPRLKNTALETERLFKKCPKYFN